MNHGLNTTTVNKIQTVFLHHPEIEKAVLYGSRAKGNYTTGSDIDLTLMGEALTADMQYEIFSELDELLLPYSIDLSLYAQLDHRALRQHIERVGVVLYARNAAVVVVQAVERRSSGI